MDTFMDLHELQDLISNLKLLPATEKKETNLFSIGARGHYENPVSDLLAFFVDPDAGHELNTLVLECFLECLPESPDAYLICPPTREVMTSEGSRIDILLEFEQWVLALENKIWHKQNNPFQDYSNHLAQKYPHKKPLLVVLSPNGDAPVGWFGVSYRQFLSVLSPRLGIAYITSPLNKWLVLLREFILHLESLMEKNKIAPETESFVLENLHKIQEMIVLKNTVIKSLQEECLQFLTNYFSDNNYEICTSLNHWEGYPALRFAFSHWLSPSDVVLFLERSSDKYSEVRIYACDLTTIELQDKATKLLNATAYDAYWPERNGKVLGITYYVANTMEDKNQLFKRVAESMTALDQFEVECKR